MVSVPGPGREGAGVGRDRPPWGRPGGPVGPTEPLGLCPEDPSPPASLAASAGTGGCTASRSSCSARVSDAALCEVSPHGLLAPPPNFS